MEIEWKSIEGYPNYLINKKGDVKSLNTGKLLKVQVNRYTGNIPCVTLSNQGYAKAHSIQGLVMKTFYPDILEERQEGLRLEKEERKKLLEESAKRAVEMYSNDGKTFIRRFNSCTEASEFLQKYHSDKGLGNPYNIIECANGEKRTSYTFKWKWANNTI